MFDDSIKPEVKIKPIKVFPYNPDYPAIFSLETNLIKQALGKNCINIHHIGSTSVPDLIAKQDIDVLCIVDELKNSLLLEKIGYIFKNELNIPLRYYFSKNTEYSKVNLHVVEPWHGFIALNLCFRDYLITHKHTRDAYASLKTKLLQDPKSYQKTQGTFTGYSLGKNDFIKKVLKKAKFNELHMCFCMHSQEWFEYHRIREEQIFNPINVVYNRMHSSITDVNHYHFVLYKGVNIVTVAHIELLNSNTEAALRSLATDELYKNYGYGAYCMNFLERWLQHLNCRVIKMHARISAEQFYRKLGYINMDFDDPCISENYVDLGKLL